MSIIQTAYDLIIRPRLAQTNYRICAGVTVRDRTVLDATKRNPGYKVGLLRAIHDQVDDGDDVLVIGAGRGVSTVHAARSGAKTVTSIDAASRMLEQCRETFADNWLPVDCEVVLRHGLVGDEIEVYGDASMAPVIPVADLPDCDVLVMDCEGAEKSILEDMDSLPQKFVIETHPGRGVPTSVIEDLLAKHGKRFDRREFEPDCIEGKFVLVSNDA